MVKKNFIGIYKTIFKRKGYFECPNCGQYSSKDFPVEYIIEYYENPSINKEGEEIVGETWFNCRKCGTEHIKQII